MEKIIDLHLPNLIDRKGSHWVPGEYSRPLEDLELTGLVVWEGEWRQLTELGCAVVDAQGATFH